MSAIGLRSTNNEGRHILLDGIRDVEGMLKIGDILELTAIDRVTTLSGENLPPGEIVDTRNRVRPILKEGLVTLEVIPVNGHWRAPHKRKPKNKK